LAEHFDYLLLLGVSAVQMLYRAGFVDVASAVETYFNNKPSAAKDFKAEHLHTIPKEKYGSIGVTRHSDVKDLDRFREWWANTPDDKRQAALKLINSFNGPYDERPITECIQAAEPYLRNKLNKAYKNSLSRIQNIQSAMLLSKFPITKMQVDSFLDVYSGKAGLAQVSEMR
jgi:hypothetical protein